MKVEVVMKTTREVDANHIVEIFKERVRHTQEKGGLWAFVPVFSLTDAAGIIETLVADNQKKDARIKDVICQCDRLFEEKKAVERQRDELADKLARLAAEKVRKSGIEPGPVKTEYSQKAREQEEVMADAENLVKNFEDWFERRFRDFL